MKVRFIKSFLFCIVFFHFHHFGFSQNDMSKNILYLELLGKGFFYSVNYERNAVQFNDLIGLNLSTGIGIFPGLTSIEKSVDVFIPLECNFSLSKNSHHFVVGYGTTYWRYKINYIEINNSNLAQQPIQPTLVAVNEWFAHMVLEYRFQKTSGGILFKVGYTPLFFASIENTSFNRSINYQTSFNLGIGWAF